MDPSQVIEGWFEWYKHDVFNFLVYQTGRIDVEDLVQETFIRALNDLDRFSGKSSPKTWLLAIARNLAIDEGRKRTRERRDSHVEIDAVVDHTESSDGIPDEALRASETQRELMVSILALPQKYRDVIILRVIMDLSIKDTAAALGWTELRVRVTFHRGIKNLKQKLLTEDRRGELHGFA